MSQVHVTDSGTGGHWNTDCTVRAHSGVRNQREHGCFERVKAQGDQQRHRDSNRDTETSRALDKAGKAEGNEQHLDALVRRNGGNRGPHNGELSATHRNAVEPHSHEHNPADRPERGEESVENRAGCRRHR